VTSPDMTSSNIVTSKETRISIVQWFDITSNIT
jgi:hypothetical protein